MSLVDQTATDSALVAERPAQPGPVSALLKEARLEGWLLFVIGLVVGFAVGFSI